jgi:predicted ABC-type ATPase
MIARPNGAGKSTLAPVLLRDTIGVDEFVNADTIALGLSAFQPDSVAFEAGRIMLRRLNELADSRASFAFETTLASRSYAPWVRRLREQTYTFHLFYLWLRSPDLAVERVRERVRLGGHDVAEAVIRRRYEKGLRNLFALYLPLADTWRVYDNSDAREPVLIAAGLGASPPTIYQGDLWGSIREAVG